LRDGNGGGKKRKGRFYKVARPSRNPELKQNPGPSIKSEKKGNFWGGD